MSLNSIEVFFTKLAGYIRQVFHIKVYSDVDFSGLFVKHFGKSCHLLLDENCEEQLGCSKFKLGFFYSVFGDSRQSLTHYIYFAMDIFTFVVLPSSVCYGLEQSDPGLVLA